MPARGAPLKRSYAGATKHATLADVRALGPRWVIQEKIDGCYARVVLNSQGRVDRVFTRQEKEFGRDLLAGIRGALLGYPHAELVGELEAFTESACAAVEKRGQRLVHLFDCLHDGTRSLLRTPYGERRAALQRMQAEVVNFGPEVPWLRDSDGRAHDRKSGRYSYEKLLDWRVAPIVPQAPLSHLGDLWEGLVKDGGGEGLVAVNLDAAVGARASKLKIKEVDGIDCVAVSVARTTVTCSWNGHLFNVSRGRHYVEEGDAVEVLHSGWYRACVLPRFARIARIRRDLQG